MINKNMKKKLMATLISTAIFIAVSHPETYKFTDNLVSQYTGQSGMIMTNNCPTVEGTFVHLLVFGVASYLSMYLRNKKKEKKLTQKAKVKYSFYASVLWFILSNKETYKLTSSLFSTELANRNGCPSGEGVIAHGLVYAGILFTLMALSKNC